MNRAQKEIVQRIAERDGLKPSRAEKLVEETVRACEECLSEDEDAYDEVEDIIKEKLGLPPKTVIDAFGL